MLLLKFLFFPIYKKCWYDICSMSKKKSWGSVGTFGWGFPCITMEKAGKKKNKYIHYPIFMRIHRDAFPSFLDSREKYMCIHIYIYICLYTILTPVGETEKKKIGLAFYLYYSNLLLIFFIFDIFKRTLSNHNSNINSKKLSSKYQHPIQELNTLIPTLHFQIGVKQWWKKKKKQTKKNTGWRVAALFKFKVTVFFFFFFLT